jgi:hypothetical protein
MTRIRLILLSMLAVLALGAVAASAASAADPTTQQEFKPGFTGFACSEAAGHREYGTLAECEKVEGVETKGGKWHRHTTTFTSTEGKSTLKAGTFTVTCEKDTNVGELLGKESVANVVVTFIGCKIGICPISSKGIPNSKGEIVTVSLKGELGEVAPAEATTEVGLLLEAESPELSKEFVTLNETVKPECEKPTPQTKINGQVVGEVTPLAKSFKDKVIFALSGGKQKIKTFERSFAKFCKGGPECKEDGVVKPRLEAFGLEATFESTDENTFSQETEVLKGA